MFVICLCGLRSWDLIFWDTVRTSKRSPAVGSAAGLPTWNICCISQTMGFCFNKAPPQMTAVWLQSTRLQVGYTCTAIIFSNYLFCNTFYTTWRLMQALQTEPKSDAGASGDLQLTLYSWRSAGETQKQGKEEGTQFQTCHTLIYYKSRPLRT